MGETVRYDDLVGVWTGVGASFGAFCLGGFVLMFVVDVRKIDTQLWDLER